MQTLIGDSSVTTTTTIDPSELNGIFSENNTQLGSIAPGDFVGISKDAADIISASIDTNIITPVNQKIDEFGGKEETFNKGLKGEVQATAIQYLDAVKNLLKAYVSTFNNCKTVMREVAESYAVNDTANAQAVANAQQDIAAKAAGIQVDPNGK